VPNLKKIWHHSRSKIKIHVKLKLKSLPIKHSHGGSVQTLRKTKCICKKKGILFHTLHLQCCFLQRCPISSHHHMGDKGLVVRFQTLQDPNEQRKIKLCNCYWFI